MLTKPEFFIPLTWHFHVFEKKSDNEYIVFLYPYETTENVKVGEQLQKYILTISSSSEGLKYIVEEQKGKVRYNFIISAISTGRNLNIMVGVEKKGIFSSVPVEPKHILEHISNNLKYLKVD
ncbi:hypothetical protein [Stygiolobus caldivivus]|nr:hypothetical protein [Stygiolobus caldivivus]